MKKQLANTILNSFTPQSLTALGEYLDEKIAFHKELLVHAQSMDVLRENQGAIKALENVKRMRDDAIAVSAMKE
jgi:hypothetical protein